MKIEDFNGSDDDPNKPTFEPRKRPTIAELEDILQQDEDAEIEILPNGEVRRKGSPDAAPKPLTMRENLGGEY